MAAAATKSAIAQPAPKAQFNSAPSPDHQAVLADIAFALSITIVLLARETESGSAGILPLTWINPSLASARSCSVTASGGCELRSTSSSSGMLLACLMISKTSDIVQSPLYTIIAGFWY